MKLTDMVEQITPEIHQRLKRAIELGKWPDGRRLSQDEKEASLQAVIAYEAHHLPEKERVGYIDRSKKDTPCESASDTKKTIKWQ